MLMRKKMIDIGDKNIEVMIGGNDCPSVVILPGLLSAMEEWELVTKELEKKTSIMLIHRPGCGNSEIGSESRTTLATVKDLNTLLDKLDVHQPVILVGHSYGGLYAQHYVKTFPHKVAGLVLIDSTSVDLQRLNRIQLTSDEDSDSQWIEKCIRYSMMCTEQLVKEINQQINENQKQLSLAAQSEILRFQTNPNLYKAMASEIQSWESCASKIKQAGTFPDIPLIVIGRDPAYTINQAVQDNVPEADARAIEDVWQSLIKEQTLLSAKSKFLLAKYSGHSVHLERPDVIIEAISSIIDQNIRVH